MYVMYLIVWFFYSKKNSDLRVMHLSQIYLFLIHIPISHCLLRSRKLFREDFGKKNFGQQRIMTLLLHSFNIKIPSNDPQDHLLDAP